MKLRMKIGYIIYLISFVMLVVGLFTQQYFVYKEEQKKIDMASHKLWAQVRKAKKYKDRLAEEMLKAEDSASRLDQILPPTLDVKKYLVHFTAIAKELNIGVRDVQSTIRQRDFYEEATLHMMLSGDQKTIMSLKQKIEAEPRLSKWKAASMSKGKVQLELTIFSLKEMKQEPMATKVSLCDGFESHVWLWPFKVVIRKKYQLLRALCAVQKEQIESIRFIHKISGKLKRVVMGQQAQNT